MLFDVATSARLFGVITVEHKSELIFSATFIMGFMTWYMRIRFREDSLRY